MSSTHPDRTIGWVLSSATADLRIAGVASPRLDAELLLGHILGKSRTRLAIDFDSDVTVDQQLELQQYIGRRIAGESVAYIVGRREFMGHDFAVGPGVLVPRPETELMVERAIEIIDRLWYRGSIRALDLCTGSGAIALSLALRTCSNRVAVVGSDISNEALGFARRNRTALGLDNRVEFVQGDLMSWTGGPWDLILSNPPYLTSSQVEENPDLAAEPRLALDGGAGGLEIVERIIDQATSRVFPRFAMIIEIDPGQADAASALARERFPTADVSVVPDLSGRVRFISIERQERKQ